MEKTPLMKYLELKFGKSIEELLTLDNVTKVAEILDVDRGTVTKWKQKFGMDLTEEEQEMLNGSN